MTYPTSDNSLSCSEEVSPTIYRPEENPPLSSALHTTIINSYLLASILSNPLNKCHEIMRRMQVIPNQYPNAYRITNAARQAFLAFQGTLYAALATVTTIPGVFLRAAGSWMNAHSFIYMPGSAPEKKNHEGSFTSLSWNVCCGIGGYSISDGGVTPWKNRIDQIIGEIIQQDADVISLYEIFDTDAGFYLQEKLAEIYPHFYFAAGQRGIGVSSGIFVASKFAVVNATFSPFPEEMLVGRTKNSSKGIFSFDLADSSSLFARIHATHLQHSEEVSFPTDEEFLARERELDFLMEKVQSVSNRATLVMGDLNLNESEYETSVLQQNFFRDPSIVNIPTWGGDAFCAELVGQRISHPQVLDYSMLKNGSARQIETTLVETGYQPDRYLEEALSDHVGLKSTITL